jgi:hypothetical protein
MRVQVRFAASRATRELVEGLPEAARAALMPILLPPMCLNRYEFAGQTQQPVLREHVLYQGMAVVITGTSFLRCTVATVQCLVHAHSHPVQHAGSGACMARSIVRCRHA